MSEQLNQEGRLAILLRRGWSTALGLAVLTLIEYIVAAQIDSPTLWLLPLIIFKGGLILEVFMHASDLSTRDEGVH